MWDLLSNFIKLKYLYGCLKQRNARHKLKLEEQIKCDFKILRASKFQSFTANDESTVWKSAATESAHRQSEIDLITKIIQSS